MIKVVIFDIDNTLLSFDGYVREAMRAGFEKYGLRAYEEYMFDVFTETNNALWQSLERGEITFAELKKVRWSKVLQRLGIDFDGEVFEAYFRESLFSSAIPEPHAIEILRYLEGKYMLCVASNGPYSQQMNRLKVCGMLPYFRHVFVSEEIGTSKPSREFFDVCLKRINSGAQSPILSEEMMMIGDSLSADISGAADFGMKTCFYTPKKAPDEDCRADFAIASLEEIKSIL